MQTRTSKVLKKIVEDSKMVESIRIWRSPYTSFGENTQTPNDLLDETVTADEVYTDQVLAKIAKSGFNGIWVHGLLHHIVSESIFPELGTNAPTHQEKLNKLIERAGKHNIKVYIYMQPPRALPISNTTFWENHSDVAGQIEEIEGDDNSESFQVQSMCTSTAKVRNYLKNATGKLGEALPLLGGIILITASEYPAHCVARRGRVLGALGEIENLAVDCPRCAKRNSEDIVVEVIKLIHDGIRSVSNSIEIIAWNWSWSFYVDAPCEEMISQLPKDVILMVGFERGGKKDILGHKDSKIDEYSISYAGPSEQCIESFDLARKHGLRCFAKLQFGTTHELATVPNLPLIGNLFKKAAYVKKNNLAGFMGCWNFGNMITANTAAFNWFLSTESPTEQEPALSQFAINYFGECDSSKIRAAWDAFADAMNNYPFCIPYLYTGPTNYALSFISHPAPLNGKTSGRSWLGDERGDDLSNAIADFSLEEIIMGFGLLVEKWDKAVELLKLGLTNVNSLHAAEEIANAEVCAGAFRSTRNLFRIYKLRLDWNNEKLTEYNEITKDELQNIKRALPYVEQDKRFGYHSEAHCYMFNAEDIRKKILAIENYFSAHQSSLFETTARQAERTLH